MFFWPVGCPPLPWTVPKLERALEYGIEWLICLWVPCPFVACPSHVCLGGRVLGIVEDDAVDLGLVLGLVLEVEEEEEERGLVVLLEVVLVSRGFVPGAVGLCSRVSTSEWRLVVVGESPAVGRVVLVGLLAFEALVGVLVPLVLVVVRVRLVVVGRRVPGSRPGCPCCWSAGFRGSRGRLVPRVLVVLGELSVRVFFALALVVVLRVRKRVRIVWSVLVLLSAAFCCSCFRAAPPLVAIVFASLFLCLVPPSVVGRSSPHALTAVPAAVSPP